MVRDNNLAKWISSSEYDVAAVLAFYRKSEFLQGGGKPGLKSPGAYLNGYYFGVKMVFRNR